MIDGVQKAVRNAPAEFDLARESIAGLLMAASYLLDIKEGYEGMDDGQFVRAAIREIQKALGPLGLGVDCRYSSFAL